MNHEESIEVRLAKGAGGQFRNRLEKAREVWATYPDKRILRDAERLKLILVLIDLQMSYLVDQGIACEEDGTDHYIAYLCLLLSVAATGNRSADYPQIMGPTHLDGFQLTVVSTGPDTWN